VEACGGLRAAPGFIIILPVHRHGDSGLPDMENEVLILFLSPDDAAAADQDDDHGDLSHVWPGVDTLKIQMKILSEGKRWYLCLPVFSDLSGEALASPFFVILPR
jgi:hypothetical protein